ncbi:MAG TPA: tetratricopeptide repeat protein, partial [Nitrososphaerales archaeon]|nr:tetratricopeptide repeat protein [Nitrososphaerales archaeon]
SGVKKHEDTKDVNAYTSYLKAVQLYHEYTERSLRESIKLFEKAISLDGNFVRAYAGLSHSWVRLVFLGYEDFTVITEKAYPASRKTLELGPNFAEAHAAMAEVAGALDRFAESLMEAEKAVQINPNLSEAHMDLGILHCNLDDLNKALPSFEKAYELDPLSVVLGGFVALIAQIAGRKTLALSVLERMRELNPRNERVYVVFANYYIQEGNFKEAQAMLDRGRSISPSELHLKINQGVLYALTGRRKEAEGVLQEILQDKIEGVRLLGEVFIHSALGNLDEAFRALTRQAETHEWDFLIRFRPLFDELRKDARYADFCNKLGIPQ